MQTKLEVSLPGQKIEPYIAPKFCLPPERELIYIDYEERRNGLKEKDNKNVPF